MRSAAAWTGWRRRRSSAPRPTAFSFCLEAIDDLGLFAYDMLGFWRKALLTPLGAAAPPKPAPSEAD